MPVFNNMLAGASGGAGAGYEIERSLRFNSGDSAYLNRTPSAAGNRKTWTWSGWVKKGANGSNQVLFSSGSGGTNARSILQFTSSDLLEFGENPTGSSWSAIYTNAVYRDPSAWYHVVAVYDSTNSTSTDRLRLYVNGIRLYSFSSSSYPSQNLDGNTNTTDEHRIGRYAAGNEDAYLNGYLADVHFIDGQALAATDFGETDNNGVWQPIEYAGTYGQSVDQSRTWSGDLSASNLASPTLMFNWTYGYGTYTGTCTWTTTNAAYSNLSGRVYLANNTTVTLGITFKDSSGTTLGSFNLPWTGDGTQMQDTGFDWSSSVATVEITGDYLPVRVQIGNKTIVDSGVTVPDNSFHLDFADNSSNAALGTDTSGNNNTWTVNNLAAQASTDAVAGTHSGKDGISFNGTNAEINLTSDSDVNPGSGVFTLECYAYALSGGSAEFGIYDGSPGGSGSFVLRRVGAGTLMVERHNTAFDITGGSFSEGVWHHVAVTRDSSNNVRLFVDGTQSGSTSTSNTHNYQGTFRLGRTNNAFTNGYISNLRLIKGTCLYTSNFTAPTGNLSNVTNTKLLMAQSTTSATAATVKPSGLTISGSGDSTIIDSLLDTPTNGTQVDTGAGGEVVGNYATLNPIDKGSNVVLSNGNLEYTKSTTTWSDSGVRGTFGISSGKWYWEVTKNSTTSYSMYGVAASAASFSESYGSPTESWTYISDSGNKFGDGAGGSGSSYGATFTNGDVIGVALDMDAGTLVFYKNGTSQGTAFSSLSGKTVFPWLHLNTSGDSAILNTGSRAFAHTAPSGYKSLNTANLTATIEDGSKYFDTKLWTGNGTSQTITGLGFSPDLVWAKGRNTTSAQVWVDNVRGAQKSIFSDQTTAELDRTSVTAFNSDGFTLGDYVNTNGNTNSYVGWAWDAGDDANPTTIAAGSLNSSLYDQSQTWSNQVSGTAYSSSYAKTYAFDNDLSSDTISLPANETTHTFTPSPAFSSASTVTIYYYYPTASSNDFALNGNDVTSQMTTTSDILSKTFNVAGTGFTSFTWSRQVGISGIKVDGKILVDSGVSITTPSIATTVRANPSAGFSISNAPVTSTDASPSIVHGLNATPEFIIGKNRDDTINWYVYHKDLPANNYLILNSTAATTTDNRVWGPVNSSAFHLGISGTTAAGMWTAGGPHNCIFYAMTSVEGYSAFTSHTVISGTNFVYLGFRPRFLMLKRTGAGSTTNIGYASWVMFDTERDTYNEVDFDTILYANRNYAQGKRGDNASSTGGTYLNIDILSNGIRFQSGAAEFSQPSDKIIICAWAEHPFKIARAR